MLQLKPERLAAAEFSSHSVSVAGRMFVADISGALYWPSLEALIIADLHLEKGSSFARRGQLLPPYDTRETLRRLAEVIGRYRPTTVIAVGDSLHDPEAIDRMNSQDVATLRVLQNDRDWIWITGNHDPEIAVALGGHVTGDLELDGIALRHVPTPGPITHEIAAHFHPAAKLSLHGYSIRRPCFVGNGRRLVLPAFGTYTGGLNILNEAFSPLFGNGGMAVWMLGQEGLYPVATRLLCDD